MIAEYAAAIAACSTIQGVQEAFRAAVLRQGYATSAARAWIRLGERVQSQNYFRNWTVQWAKLSDEKGFVDKSPVLAEARRRIAPFTWHEAKEQHPPSAAEREVWGIVAEWGFRDGFVVPVHAPRG
jgi:LuxR family quorum sensing-dependent transcriptional regulator